MQFLKSDGADLAYEDTMTDLPPILFVHGCGSDHGSFASPTQCPT